MSCLLLITYILQSADSLSVPYSKGVKKVVLFHLLLDFYAARTLHSDYCTDELFSESGCKSVLLTGRHRVSYTLVIGSY